MAHAKTIVGAVWVLALVGAVFASSTLASLSRFVLAVLVVAHSVECVVYLPKLRRAERFDAWLLRIAHNRAINEVGRRPTVRLEDIAEPLDPSPFGSPVERAEHKAEVERLRRELLELSPAHREVLLLRFLHELSHAEIAKALGKREEAVRALQYRALRQLRRRFEASE